MATEVSNSLEMSNKTSDIKSDQDCDEEDKEKISIEEEIFKITGNSGFWQLRVFLVLFIISMPGAWQNLSVSFLAPNIDYWCARPSKVYDSIEIWKETALPPDDKRCSK